MIRKYHNHKPQTTPWHREEEPLNHHEPPGRQIKQSNQLSLPHQTCRRAFQQSEIQTSLQPAVFIKPVVGLSNKVRFKPAYLATETS